ncbi:MAG TPA: cell division protein FtsZ [Rhodospirillales bacterium]|nr:cell division protein FtsZ [Rhodospirillales bacterium]
MTINLSVPKTNETPELKPRITVIGVGGAGGNAVNNMIEKELEGVDFIVANTDAQALVGSKTDRRVQLGAEITGGLGAGSRPEVGCRAAQETLDEVLSHLDGSHMVFIAAGMGGGTGTGAAPVIAKAAKEKGILTVAVVTKPFQFEGAHRMKIATGGIEELERYVDTMIVIPNQNLFRIANEKTTFADAFNMADEVLYSGVRGVTDLMVMPGLINLDFADIHSVMSEMGKAMMGTGEAEGERRALDAAEAAISNPLLDDTSMAGAKGVLINITGGQDMTLFEADEAANRIRSEVDTDAYIIFGSTFDESLEGKIRVSVVATGMDRAELAQPEPTMLSVAIPSVVTTTEETGIDEDETTEQALLDIVAGAACETVETPEPVEISEPDQTDIADAPAFVAPASPDELPVAVDPGQPVPATPGINTADAFIPKAAISRTGKPDFADADPYAAADMANGNTSGIRETPVKAKRSRGMSLFEKVTGIGASAKRSAPKLPENATPMGALVDSLGKGPAKIEPLIQNNAAPASAPALATEPTSAAEPNVEQETLGGLDATDRLAQSHPEEDLLDIPAFLRRQAN